MEIVETLVQTFKRIFPARKTFTVPVLCYHSWTAGQSSYQGNDHAAMASDLDVLAARGYKILPIPALVEILTGGLPFEAFAGEKLVGITFDDGCRYDFHDHSSENGAPMPSFRTLLKDSKDVLQLRVAGPRGVSFVIASPECRNTIGDGPTLYSADWWADSAREGVVGIANHSWDHVHESLNLVKQCENLKGSFLNIASLDDANAQIRDAHDYISDKTDSLILPYFGYPFGHVSDYLAQEYFPLHGKELGIKAAFSTDGEPVKEHTNVWNIPRYVCGDHWKSERDFLDLLEALEES